VAPKLIETSSRVAIHSNDLMTSLVFHLFEIQRHLPKRRVAEIVLRAVRLQKAHAEAGRYTTWQRRVSGGKKRRCRGARSRNENGSTCRRDQDGHEQLQQLDAGGFPFLVGEREDLEQREGRGGRGDARKRI
jgi:hypothetical protein